MDFDSNSNSNSSSARGMTAEEEARLSDAAYLKVWNDAGIPHPPLSASMNRRKKQFFMYVFDCLGYASNSLFALRNPGMADAYEDLSSKGAVINRSDLDDKSGRFGSAVTALQGSQAWHASPEGQKSATIRDVTERIQYALCKAVIQKVSDISFEKNPDVDNPNDNGAGYGNVVADMLSKNTGSAKEARSEILAELIYIQVANIILHNISAQYVGGISWLEDQIRLMYGAAALQEYKHIVTDDNTQSYVNRVWLYALLIFLDQNPTNNRGRQITNSPTSWFGFTALAAVVFKYRDIEILPHQIEMAISDTQQITTLDGLKQFCKETIAVDGEFGNPARYTVGEIDHLFDFNMFPRDDLDVTLERLDESVQSISSEIKRNASGLRAIGSEMQTGRDAAARSYEKYVEQGLGVQSGVPRDLRVRPSSLYEGQYFDPDRRNIGRDNSQRSIDDNSQNSLETAYSPVGTENLAAPPGTFPSKSFLDYSGYTASILPPTAAFVEKQEATGYNKSTKGNSEYKQQLQQNLASSSSNSNNPYAKFYNSKQPTITSVLGLSGNRDMNSNSNSSSSSQQSHWFEVGDNVVTNAGQQGIVTNATAYAGSGTHGQRLTINVGNGSVNVDSSKVKLASSSSRDSSMNMGGRRRKTRKIRKYKKTKKAKKSKKSKKSRKSKK